MIFSVASVKNIGSYNSNSPSLFDKLKTAVSWDPSDYTNYTGLPIINVGGSKDFRVYIDDNDPNYNWTKTAAENAWCTGSGAYSDPYIIEDMYINGGGDGGFIYIKNSIKYFVIRNCWFHYSGSDEFDVGVFTRLTENGTIENNIFSFSHVGVFLEFSTNNISIINNFLISDDHTAGFGRAIELAEDCYDNIITNNKIRNFHEVMAFFRCHNNIIVNNYAENDIFVSSKKPIHFTECDYFLISQNVFSEIYAIDGAFLISELNCTDNSISNNSVISEFTNPFEGINFTDIFDLSQSIAQEPKVQALDSTINLENSNHNSITNNYIYIEPTTTNGGIPGYDLYIVLGIISIISLALLKRRSLTLKN